MSVTEKIKQGLGEKVVDWNRYSPRRVYVTIRPEDLKEAALFLFKTCGLRLCIATGTDTPESIEISYHFSSDETGEIFSLRVHLTDKDNPELDSLTDVTTGANWIEREMWELLGVNFVGHPKLERLLLNEDWPEGKYPLRNTPDEQGELYG